MIPNMNDMTRNWKIYVSAKLKMKIIVQIYLNSLNLSSKRHYMHLGRIIPNKYKHRLEAKIRLNRAH